jgi:hypothetical protein
MRFRLPGSAAQGATGVALWKASAEGETIAIGLSVVWSRLFILYVRSFFYERKQ